jgi:hypothetical protein
MNRLHSGLWQSLCSSVLILAAVIIGCKGSNEKEPALKHRARTSVVDTQSVALGDKAPGEPSRINRRLFSKNDKPVDIYANRSEIVMHLHSNNDYLLTDPEGRRTGIDPLSGNSYADIPYSTYEMIGLGNLVTGNPGPTSNELTVSEPIDGDFLIRIVGTYEERYSLEILGYDKAGTFARPSTGPIPIELYAVHAFTLRYKKGNEKDLDSMTLRGGYDGTGDEEGDGNLLLSYFTCSSSDVELPAGTKQFSLGVWCFEGTDPESFAATLNGEDITALFAPKANSNEIVTFDISQSSNSLVLKIEGDVQSRRLIDTDTFEITVSP